MKSVEFSRYGSPDDLRIIEVDKPAPTSGEVLVRIHACSINSWDWELLHATPLANRVMFGLWRPKRLKTLGFDIAGTVEAVGRLVTRFKTGDRVYGDLSACGMGGFADYVAAPEDALTIIPDVLSFQQAAAVPQAGLLAWQALVKIGHLRDGQKILINGASGGSGTFALQIARAYDVDITAVCSADKMEFVRSLGAHQVLDYERDDFTRAGKQYDLIIDAHALRSIRDYRRALQSGGCYVVHGGASSTIMAIMLLGPIISLLGRKRLRILLHRANLGMDAMNELLRSGKVTPVIDRVYPFKEVIAAFKYYGAGRARGKVVVRMED